MLEPSRTLDEATALADPIAQFDRWFHDAVAARLPQPEAMALATAGTSGLPSARMVLLKAVTAAVSPSSTNSQGRKSHDLEETPRAALLFFWSALQRQVRIEGPIEKLPASDSDAYFATRPRDSRIGAWASPQSETIPD